MSFLMCFSSIITPRYQQEHFISLRDFLFKVPNSSLQACWRGLFFAFFSEKVPESTQSAWEPGSQVPHFIDICFSAPLLLTFFISLLLTSLIPLQTHFSLTPCSHICSHPCSHFCSLPCSPFCSPSLLTFCSPPCSHFCSPPCKGLYSSLFREKPP